LNALSFFDAQQVEHGHEEAVAFVNGVVVDDRRKSKARQLVGPNPTTLSPAAKQAASSLSQKRGVWMFDALDFRCQSREKVSHVGEIRHEGDVQIT
jgi:hypothetical protein